MTEPNEESKKEGGENELGQEIPDFNLMDTDQEPTQTSAFAVCKEEESEIKADQAKKNEQNYAFKELKKQSYLNHRKYLTSKNFALTVFSFLPGCDLFHKIALLNRKMRKELPGSGILDQEKELSPRVLSRREGLRGYKIQDFSYGFELATVINFASL